MKQIGYFYRITSESIPEAMEHYGGVFPKTREEIRAQINHDRDLSLLAEDDEIEIYCLHFERVYE